MILYLFIYYYYYYYYYSRQKGGLHPSLAPASQGENRFLWAHSTYNKQPKRLNYGRGN